MPEQDKDYRHELRDAWRRSGLTQNEFARTLPPNPKTGLPYHPRTLRKIMSGERGIASFRQSEITSGTFVQHVRQGDQTYSYRLQKPAGMSTLDLLTTEHGREIRKEAIKDAVRRRTRLRSGAPRTNYSAAPGYEAFDVDDPFDLDDIGPARPKKKTRAETYIIRFHGHKVDKRTGEILD